jgi:hypothetical protein
MEIIVTERAKSDYCSAAIFLDGPQLCLSCKKQEYALSEDGESLDLGYVFDSFQSASAKAREFSAKYGHDVHVIQAPETSDIWLLVTNASCLYELVEATKTPFDHVNSPYHHMGPSAKIAPNAPFDETFEYFKRILLNARRSIMIFPDQAPPYWSIAEECNELGAHDGEPYI